MTTVDYAEKARRWFRRTWAEPSARAPADRRRMVGHVEQLLRARARRRAIVRLGAGIGTLTLAVAASVAIVPRLALWSARRDPVASLSLPSGLRSPPDVHSPETGTTAVDARALRVLDIHPGRGSSSVRSPAAPQVGQVREGMTLPAGAELVAAPSSHIRIGTAEGTSLAIEADSRLVVAENDLALQRFTLKRGAVRLRVTKLRAGERFVVETVDAEIEVHGTEFRVALAVPDRSCGAGTVTRVSVTEGVVTVRSHGTLARLVPGDEWPAKCRVTGRASIARAHQSKARGVAALAPFAARASSSNTVLPEDRRTVNPRNDDAANTVEVSSGTAANVVANPIAASALAATPTPRSSRSSADGHSRLSAQNDLFAAAVSAKVEGRTSEAIRLFAELVRRYPDGPLVESALVLRMKLLRLSDPRAAKEAATAYLVQFPGGFARGDARALLGPQAPP